GHRRFRALRKAAQGLGVPTDWFEGRRSDRSKFVGLPVHLRLLSDGQMDALAWAENKERSDLNPVEEAQAIADRIERHGWTHEHAGEALGLSRSAVSNKLRLLRLPTDALDALRKGTLTEGKARQLVRLVDCVAKHEALVAEIKNHQVEAPDYIIQQSCSDTPLHTVEFWVDRFIRKVE